MATNIETTHITVLYSLISILGLWVLVFKLFRAYLIEVFKHGVFELRNQLFLSAADGNIPFNHPAYCMLRSTMNGAIRFNHHITLTQVVVLHFLPSLDDEHNSYNAEWKKATDELDEPVRNELIGYRRSLNVLVFKYMVLSSPEVVLVGIVGTIFVSKFIVASLLSLIITISVWLLMYLVTSNYTVLISKTVRTLLDDLDIAACIYGKNVKQNRVMTANNIPMMHPPLVSPKNNKKIFPKD